LTDQPDVIPDDISTYFSRKDGSFQFRRWGVPIVPHVFGPAAPDMDLFYQAFESFSGLTGHPVVRAPDGAGMNLTLFFLNEARDLMKMPGSEGLLGMLALIAKDLMTGKQSLKRNFTTDPKTGAITQMSMIVRMSGRFKDDTPEILARRMAALTQLAWSMARGPNVPPLTVLDAPYGVLPRVADILRVAYDPSLPDASSDPSICIQIDKLIRAQVSP
jgi:hypothetical protein